MAEIGAVRRFHSQKALVAFAGIDAPPDVYKRQAVECALLGLDMAKKGHVFQPGEGIVKDTVEKTIESMGRVGRVGMHETDIEILHIMMGK